MMTPDELELQKTQAVANELKLLRNGSFTPEGVEEKLAECTAKIRRLMEKIKRAKGDDDLVTR